MATKPAVEMLIPQQRVDEVAEACRRVADGHDAIRQRLFEAATCGLGPVVLTRGITEQAQAFIDGDPSAGAQLAHVLRVPRAREVVDRDHAEMEKFVEEQLDELRSRKLFDLADSVLPVERWFPVAIAAAMLDIAHPKSTHRHLAMLHEQLETTEDFRRVVTAAQRVLRGGGAEIKMFRATVEVVAMNCMQSQAQNLKQPVIWPPDGPPRIPRDEFDAARVACMFEVGRAISGAYRGENAYRIDAIRSRGGCAGDNATIAGSGFGTEPHTVVFPTESGRAHADVRNWSDTSIEVVLPNAVQCGEVSLLIPLPVTQACGRQIRTHRPSSGNVRFNGGIATIDRLQVNGSSTSSMVEDNAMVSLAWDVCPSNAETSLSIGSETVTTRNVSSSGVEQLQVGTLRSDQPLRISLAATTSCNVSPSTKTVEIRRAMPHYWPLRRGPFAVGEREMRIPISQAQTAQTVTINDYVFRRPSSYRAMVYFPTEHEGDSIPIYGLFPSLIWGHAKRWPVEARAGAMVCANSDPATVDVTRDYQRLSGILRHLARWGYVVVCPDLSWLTPDSQDTYAAAMSDAAHWILNPPAASPFGSVIDRSTMGLLGHSTSAFAVSSVAGLGDLPVGAAVYVAPAAGETVVSELTPRPVLVLNGENDFGPFGDGDVPPRLYDAAHTPKVRVDIGGANHFGYTDNVCIVADDSAAIDRADQQRIAKAYITAFLQYSLRNDQRMLPYLQGHRIEGLEGFDIDSFSEL